MPFTGFLSAFIRPAEAGGVVAAELKQHRLTVKLAHAGQLVTGPLAGDCAVEEANVLKRPNGPAHLCFREPKVRAVG